jgi:hypothetical protein
MNIGNDILLEMFNGSLLDHIKQEKLPFLDFANEVLEDFMRLEPSKFHKLAPMHEEWFQTIEDNTYSGILCARGHLKTTFILTFCAYMMANNPNFRALYLSSTIDQSLDKLEQFEEISRRTFWLSPMIKDRQDRGGWRRGAKYYKNGSRIQAASIGKALEGPHVHLIILDDVIAEFPRIADQKSIHYIRRVVMPMRLPEGKIVLIGTQKRINDASHWVTESDEWASIRHPALLEDGTPRWKEYWTLDRLEKEKLTMGSRAFESEYLLNPIDPESALITWDVIEPCLDPNLSMDVIPDGWEILMGVDLAVGIDQKNDETSYCVIAWNRDTNDRQLVYQWTGRVLAEGEGWLRKQVENIVSMSEKYKPTKIMIETNGFQRLVAHAAETLAGLPVSKHNTGSEKHHGQIGIPAVALRMEQGKYRIPWDKEARNNILAGSKKLVDGLMQLVWDDKGRLEGHTADSVVSLWMCELAIQEIESKRLSFTSWENF